MKTQDQATFCIINLGCKLSYAESSTIARQLQEMGMMQVTEEDGADLYVVHTCAVTEQAERKCRQAIRKISTCTSDAFVCVSGCYANLRTAELSQLPEVNMVVNHPSAIFRAATKIMAQHGMVQPALPEACSASGSFFEAYSLGDRTRSFLKVQDGCDYRCSYCTVPLARGSSRNIAAADVLVQANKLAQCGVREVVLTGVNVGDFGKTTGESFLQLLCELEGVEGIERYRISSIEPNLLSSDIIQFVAQSKKFLPHFHIPLQGSCNRILALMRRRYTREQYADKCAEVRSLMPDAFIGVDVIAGFPTETEAEFTSGYQFLEALQPAYLHVFPYSRRPNTPAADMQQVPSRYITDRAKRLGILCKTLHRKFYEQNIGRSAQVLFEDARKGDAMFGFSENYIKVAIPYQSSLANTICTVKMRGLDDNGNMRGEVCS